MSQGTSARTGTIGTRRDEGAGGGYKWIALSNTTLGVTMAALDGTIVIIAMPAIFRGIGLDPLAPGNIGYLLWMILGYLLVSAVLVVSLGRLGDMYGRVRLYNLGFVVFSGSSLALSLDPFTGAGGAWWLIVWRMVQAVGGAMLTANSAAILTDAFPARQRGLALGVNQISALAGQFLGLVAGGLLAAIDWRAVFWVSVPLGVLGTGWSYRSLREVGTPRAARIDWVGNLTFTAGTAALLIGITYGIQPYGGHATGWTNPWVLGALATGVGLLAVFCAAERRVAEPMFDLALFRIRAFAAGNAAQLLMAVARGGLQFILIIWLQGIWLPLHGYDFRDTPLWAGIYLLPLTAGFLLAGPASGSLSDRYGQRRFATMGAALTAVAFLGLQTLPVNFGYPALAGWLLLSGFGQGMFSSPNTSAIMSSVPAGQRGVASGMRSTFQNSGTALSIGVTFSLMVAGLAGTLPETLAAGLRSQAVPAGAAEHAAGLPPVSTLFAAFLGDNPIGHLLGPLTSTLPSANALVLTGTRFFPRLISAPFHHGLHVVFTTAAVITAVAATASLLRGRGRTASNLSSKPKHSGDDMSTDALTAGTITITGQNGDEIEAYEARPTGRSTYGGVVVIHHMPGYDAATKEIVRRFAAHGYAALCPNLYSRQAPGASPDDAAAAVRAAGGVADDQLVGDVEGAARHLRSLDGANGKVGVIGYCSGGRQSFLAACSLDLDAAVDCYGAFVVNDPPSGMPPSMKPILGLAPQLSCPLLGLFGADDSYPGPEETAKLAAELDRLGKEHEFHTYEGAGHAFFAVDRPSYRHEAAVDGWAKVFDFFGRHLSA